MRRWSRRFPPGTELAQFGLGCFWGAERKFWQAPGVVSTQVGYAGGFTPNPYYEEVCTGTDRPRRGRSRRLSTRRGSPTSSSSRSSGKATTPRRACGRGTTSGTQYRSAIYTYSDAAGGGRRGVARCVPGEARRGRDSARSPPRSAEAPEFWYAEDYHQQYLHKNPERVLRARRHRRFLSRGARRLAIDYGAVSAGSAPPSLTAVVITQERGPSDRAGVAALPFRRTSLVVDSGSEDGTREAAVAAGAEVALHPFTDYASQRNSSGRASVTTEWALMVDADERVSPELARRSSARSMRGRRSRGSAAFRLRAPQPLHGAPTDARSRSGDERLTRLMRARAREVRQRGSRDPDRATARSGTSPGPMEHLTHVTLRDAFDKTLRYAIAVGCET